MAEMTYLEIVNRVIDESKVQLDELTSSNFASPPRTVLYSRLKQWVNTAYEELVEERVDWQFRTERAIITLYPRIYVTVAGGYVPNGGDTLIGASSGTAITIVAARTSESIENNSPLVEYVLDVTFADGTSPENMIMREAFDLYSGLVLSSPGAFTLLGLGRYDFSEITGLEGIDMDSVRAHYTPADALLYGQNFTEGHPVASIPWSKWSSDYDFYPYNGQSLPTFISEAPNGQYALYPLPVSPIQLSFDYRRRVTPMVLYNDRPEGLPERYHMYLVWKTVAELADYDKNGPLYQRAQKHLNKYDFRLIRDELPRIRFSGWDGGYTSG